MNQYEYLKQGVDFREGGYHANTTGVVTSDGIPFFHVMDAVKYMMKKVPDLETMSYKPIRVDKESCKRAVKVLEPEIKRLKDIIEDMLKEQEEVIDSKVKQRDSMSDRDLVESVNKQVLQDQIQYEIGKFSGITEVSLKLSERLFEFIDITSMKGG